MPGAKITGPIDLFDRDGASGTQDAFQHIFLGETLKISPSATQRPPTASSRTRSPPTSRRSASCPSPTPPASTPVGYEGIPCTLRNAKSGQYLGVRNFWMVTKGAPKGEALKFLSWVTSGNKTTTAIINSSWIAIH